MPITEKQLEQRRTHLGSSDMAVIMGLSPFKTTPADVYYAKRGLVPPSESNAAMSAGNRLERSVLAWAQTELGPLKRNQRRVHPRLPLAANVDAIVRASGEPVEAKTSGIAGPIFGSWGEAGTSEIPDHVIIQSHVHMMCVGASVCHVPALLGGRGFVMYRVDYNQIIADAIAEAATGFWACVEAGVPPPDSAPSEQVYKTLRRQPGTWAEVSPDAVDRYETATAKRLEIEKEEKAAKADIMRQIGTAEGALLEGGRILTYYEQARKSLDIEKLEQMAPDAVAACRTELKYRVLRIAKGK
jgi:putative phage-type endonuclease